MKINKVTTNPMVVESPVLTVLVQNTAV